MPINERQSKILELLSQEDNYLSSIELARIVDVTHKTVQSDIKEIMDFLLQYNVNIESKRGYGYHLVFKDHNQRSQLITLLSRRRYLKEEQGVFGYLVCVLTLFPRGKNSQHFVEMLEISKNELDNIVEQLNLSLKRHYIHVEYREDFLLLLGEEHHIRFAYIHFYQYLKINPVLSEFYFEYYNKYLENNYLHHTDEVELILQNNGINITEDNMDTLHDYLDIQHFRYNNGCKMQDTIQKIKPIAGQIAIDMSNCVSMSKNERLNLSYVIEFLVDKMYIMIEDMTPISKRSQILMDKIDDFFMNRLVAQKMMFQDLKRLTYQVKCAIIVIHLQNNLGYFDSFSKKLARDPEFVVALEIASHLTFRVETHMKERFYVENAFSLAKIINTGFSLNIWAVNQDLQIYSKHSISEAHLLRRNLARRFGDRINAYNISSLEEVELSSQKRERPIIVTDSLRIKEEESVIYSDSLLNYDEIGSQLDEIVDEEYNLACNFLGMFSRNRISIGEDYKNIGQIVRRITEKYQISERAGKIIERNIFARERRYFSVVSKGVAVPRIFLNDSTKPVIEVIIPKRSFTWNDTLVKMILVYILPRNLEGAQYLGRPLLRLLDDKDLVDSLSISTSYDEFFLKLSNYFEIV